MTQKDGRRWSAASAYLRPAMARPNLTVVTHALACQVRFDGQRAVGVDYFARGRAVFVAAGEVFLAAGAINSPHLLLLSGVGPADDLRAHGIEVVHDLPSVGGNLQDHLSAVVRYEITQPISLQSAAPSLCAGRAKESDALKELLTSDVAETGGFLHN